MMIPLMQRSFLVSPTQSSACPLVTCLFLLLPSTTPVLWVSFRFMLLYYHSFLTSVYIPRDRQFSHFPVYQKDHLFNSNPGWDFGAFRHLEILVKQTNFNSTRCSWASGAQKNPRSACFSPWISPFLSFSQVRPCVFWKREVCVCGQRRARAEYRGSGERGRHRVWPPVLRLPAHDPRAARQTWHCQAAQTQPTSRLGSDSRCVSTTVRLTFLTFNLLGIDDCKMKWLQPSWVCCWLRWWSSPSRCWFCDPAKPNLSPVGGQSQSGAVLGILSVQGIVCAAETGTNWYCSLRMCHKRCTRSLLQYKNEVFCLSE